MAHLVARLCHRGWETLRSIATVHLCIEALARSPEGLLLLLGHCHVAVVAMASLAMAQASLAERQATGRRLQLKQGMLSPITFSALSLWVQWF